MGNAIEPTDVRLRRARRFQLARRGALALSLAFMLALPALHTRGLLPSSTGGAPWSVAIFGFEIMDPLAALSLLVARSASIDVVIAALPALVVVFIFGRFFCGWLCPYVPLIAATENARALLKKLGVPILDVKLSSRAAFIVLATLLCSSALFGAQLAALVYPPSIIARSIWKASLSSSVGIGVAFLMLALVADIVLGRALWCRSLCPGGALFRVLGRLSPVHVVREPDKCTDCRVCDVVCRLDQSPMTDRTDAGCERCARCVSACPTGALDIVLIERRRR